MKYNLFPIIVTALIGCSSAPQVQPTPKTLTENNDPTSYRSLSPQQVKSCATLFMKAEHNPQVFHSASTACQDYVIRSAMRGISNFLKTEYWLNEGFPAYWSKQQAQEALDMSDCIIKPLHNLDKVLTGEKIEPSPRCQELMSWNKQLTCTGAKQQYLSAIDRFEKQGLGNEAYTLIEQRAPTSSHHALYQRFKKAMAQDLQTYRTTAVTHNCTKN